MSCEIGAGGGGMELTEDDAGVALVLGSEGQGISREAADACRPVSIPLEGDMESLNVAVAGGILMHTLSQGHRRRHV